MDDKEQTKVGNTNNDDDDDDNEQPRKEVEANKEYIDDYPSGSHDLFVLTMYHVHLARRMFDGVVRFYNFNIFCYVFNVN